MDAMNGSDLEFCSLGLEHESAFTEYISEFTIAGEDRVHGYLGKPTWSHAATVEKFDAWSRGEDLDGWVPNTTRFLFAKGRILGNYNLRHDLNETLKLYGGHCGYSVRPSKRGKGYGAMLLADAKEVARHLGLRQMLVICSVNNVASARVIEHNRGICEGVVHDESSQEDLSRYWITL